jgi:hypothetical protein
VLEQRLHGQMVSGEGIDAAATPQAQ